MKFHKMVVTYCCLLAVSFAYAATPDTLWVKKVHPEGNGCNSVAFSKDGSQLLAGTNCHNAFAKLYNSSTGVEQWMYSDSSLMCFMDVKFSPNGERFAIMEEFGILLIFDYTVNPPVRIAQVDTRSNASLALTFAPNNQSIITSGFDDSIRVFNLATNTQTRVFGTHTNMYAITTNGKGDLIATGSQNGSIRIWDTTGNMIRSVAAFSQSVPVRSIAFNQDGTRLFCIGQNGQFRSYYTSTWQLDTAFSAHSSTGTGISIAPDGSWLATSGGHGKAILWSTNSYKPFHTLELPMLGTLSGVAIAPDGKKVALASSLGYAAMFDIQNVPTSLKENVAFAFNNPVSLYPNPLTDVLKIEINQHTPVLIRISNQLGQIVWEQTLSSTQNIQISDWQSGYYMVQAFVDGNIHLTKLVK
jgi:WD40 repeat protein